ncbi:hypothetical protein FRC09_007589 [Ceratobasidium sp. 395]|nr:hypothetical protein FRC09_007589 [Ceratobasidium sp. 395]
MMAEASMHEDWEPPARRQLKPRKWTDHDWRMLAHYLRRVQKSQALAKGLSSREELDLMMVNVHAVVNRFVEEEAHGIKLEGEWARSEITGRAVYLIIKEQHKKDGTWKSTALGDPSFSTILADMTRPRAPSEDQEEDLSGEPVLPAALSELPARSRAAASHLLAGPANNTTEAESDGHVSGTADEDEDESGDEGLDPRDAPLRNKPSSPEKRSPKRSPIRPNVQITVMHQRTQELRGVRNVPNATVSDYSSFVDQTRQTTPSTTFSRLIGSLSSIIGGRSLAQTTEPPTSFPTLKPSSHNQIDLTHLDDELSFPTLNHVPTPARPTPARPKRQIRVEPKINLPTLQHISPARPVELSRSPRKRIRRTASVRELAMSFEKMGEENRQAAEAARSRVGYGRSVSGPVGGSRSMTNESPGLTEVSNNIPQPVTLRTSPQRAAAQQVLKDEVEVIEISDTSTTTRGSVDL